MDADLSGRLQSALSDRYRLERELGRGGMAVVYLATDLKHGRQVALKVLRAELTPALGAERFQREIGIAARLQHPNILSLHDSGAVAGMLYYAMPYVEGESLRARLRREVQLDIGEAVRIASEVAGALAHAHGAGVIHRDIKPENILLSGSGHALVADFGIARALDAAGGEALTETGLSLGTPCYMSPEQAMGGRALDGRSDLYALGCLLYEMLAGEPPFTGPTAQTILARHAVDAVPSLRTVRPTVSVALEAVITRSLAKVPADRYLSTADFQVALDQALQVPAAASQPRRRQRVVIGLGLGVALAVGATLAVRASRPAARPVPSADAVIRSLAVESFENLTGDSGQVYLAKGITGELEAELSQIGALRVIGLTDVEGQTPALQAASKLGVDAVLAGSLQRAGNTLRITAQIRSVSTGQSIWARRFDGDLSTVLQLQADVARAVAERIQVSLTAAERSRIAGSRRQVTPAAYEAYVRGTYFYGKAREADYWKAIGYFRKALDADPSYATAYAGMANSYTGLGYFGTVAPEETFPKARVAALKALELDSTLPAAHLAAAYEKFYGEWDFVGANREFRRALELDPSSAQIHWLYGMHLTAMNRTAEAVAEVERAQALDPLSVAIQAASARSYYNGRRYHEAILQARSALEIDSTFSRAHFWVGMASEQLGRRDEAIREFETTVSFGGPATIYLAALGHAYGVAGHRDKALAVVADLQTRARGRYVSALDIATVYLGLGDTDATFEWLERAFQTRASALVYLAVDPRYDVVREDPRFQDLVRRVGLPAVTAPLRAKS
jgi:serine/threonine protein kinase/tetratricopeptide (TPR) repeat protein